MSCKHTTKEKGGACPHNPKAIRNVNIQLTVHVDAGPWKGKEQWQETSTKKRRRKKVDMRRYKKKKKSISSILPFNLSYPRPNISVNQSTFLLHFLRGNIEPDHHYRCTSEGSWYCLCPSFRTPDPDSAFKLHRLSLIFMGQYTARLSLIPTQKN